MASSSTAAIPLPTAVADAVPGSSADFGYAGLNRDGEPVSDAFGTPGLPQWNDYPMAAGIQSHASAAEPTVGIKWVEDAPDPLFFKTQFGVGRAVWDDSQPGVKPSVQWLDRSVKVAGTNAEANTWAVIDPILHVNEESGRVFAGQMRFPTPCGNMWYSDDEGVTWIPMQLACSPNGGDHQKVGSGPFSRDVAVPPEATALGVETAVYYCAQYPGIGGCGASYDGGLTFRTQQTMPCGSFQGPIAVSPEGYVAVPNRSCGAGAGFSFSSNNGQSWSARGISGLAGGQMDPSVGFSRGLDETGKTLTYLAVAKPNGAYVAVSNDFGLSWFDLDPNSSARYVNVGAFHDPPVTGAEFINVQVGDADRAAVSFLGLTTGTPNQSSCPGSATQVWHMYVGRTYDGGATWDVQQVSSHPVQIGSIFTGGLQVGVDSSCRNLLEFNDLAIDDHGRLHVGFADGCPGTGACTTSSRGAKATVIRQGSGLGLFAAFDEQVQTPPEVTITSPAHGATDVPSDTTVQGIVDRQGEGTGPALTVEAGGPYSGPAQQAIAVAATVTGGAGGHACSWSGSGATFADAAQCSTTVTFASGTGSPFTIAVTASEAGFASATDSATVTVAVAHGTLLGTDPEGDTGTTGCPAGGVPPCNGANVDAARPGLDLLAAYVRAEAGDVVFTFVVDDASKFLVDPSGDPAAGAATGGRILEYNLNVGYIAGPTSGEAPYGVAHDVSVSRVRGSPDLSAAYDRKVLTPAGSLSGGPLSLAAVPGVATIDAANNLLTVRFTVAQNADHLEPLNDITVTSSYVIQGSGSNHVITVDDLDAPATTTWASGSTGGLPPLPVPAATLAKNSCSGTLPSPSFPAAPVCTLDVPAGASEVVLYYNTTYTGTWSAIVELFDPGAASRGYSLEDCPQPPPGAMATFSCVLTSQGAVAPGDWSAEIYYQLGEATEDYTLTLVARSPNVAPLAVDANGPYAGVAGTPIAIAATASGGVAPRACSWEGAGATFAAANLCSTTVTFATEGTKTLTVTASDASTGSASDTASVVVTDGSTPIERVEVYDGATLLGSQAVGTSEADPTAAWSIAVNDLAAGQRTLTAKWFDDGVASDGSPLALAQVTFTVGGTDPCEGVTDGPDISGISWSATQTAATITWTTDRAGTALVEYGTSTSYGSSVEPAGARTSHTVQLSGLSPGTTYHYRVSASDCGHTTQSVDNELQTAPATPSVSITSPDDGSEQSLPVALGGTFDASSGQTREGTGIVNEQQMTSLELQDAVASASWRAAADRLEGVDGFVGGHPVSHDFAVAYLAGAVPDDAPLFLHGWSILYVADAAPHTLMAPVTPAVRQSSDHMSVAEALARWQDLQADEPAGPPTPGIQSGIGPGSALQQGIAAADFICTASYLFQDPRDPEQYYLATAGHCLLEESDGQDMTGANVGQVNGFVSICFSNCVMNADLGFGFGEYVDLTAADYPAEDYPDPATRFPVAYASAAPEGAADAEGIGRDFGLIRIPKSMNDMLRPWLTLWGGPDGRADTAAGDALGIYGHGTHCCPALGGVTSRTPADQGRILLSLGSAGDGSFSGLGLTSGGDSGAAIGILSDDAEGGLRADLAMGVNTHGIITGGIMDGTLLSKGVAMANAKLGFAPVLVKAADAIVLPDDDGPEPGASFTQPAAGAALDKDATPTVTVTGQAQFPGEGAGTGGTGLATYHLHRTACGTTEDRTYMDTVAGEVADGGDGCGSLAAPVGIVFAVVGAPPVDLALTADFPADPAPASTLRFDTSRKPHASVGVSGREGTPVLLGAFEGTLSVDGVVVATGSMSSVDPITRVELDLDWTAAASSAPAGSNLVFTWTVEEGAGGAYMSYGGPQGSRLTIPTVAPAVQAVQVSVDDDTFTTGLLPTTGSTSWSAAWPLGEVANGPHTLYARILQDGTPVSGQTIATRDVTVGGEGPQEYTVQVRLQRGATEVLAFTEATVQFADAGEDHGTWSYSWSPASAPSGTYTVSAQLMLGDTVVATAQPTTFVVPGSTSSSTSTTSTTTTTTSPPLAPTLTGISPSNGPAAGGTVVTLSGTRFNAGTTVTFDGIPATDITFVESRQLTARAPAGTVGATADVTVSNGEGLTATLADAFLYTGGSTGTTSTTSTSGSAGGSGSNQKPTVNLDALSGVSDLRNDADHPIPFTGIAQDNNGCNKLVRVEATLIDPANNALPQEVAFSADPGDCASADATRSFAGTIDLKEGAMPGLYKLAVQAYDTTSGGLETSGEAQVTFLLRVPNVLEFSYSDGVGMRFRDFDPGDTDVPTENFLIVENTDNIARDVWFDITNLVHTGGDGEIVLVDNLHVLVMDGYTAGADFASSREEFFDATSIPLGTLGAGEFLALRLSIDQVPTPLADGVYAASFGITEG